MRALIPLLLLGALALPAAADPHHGHCRGHRGHGWSHRTYRSYRSYRYNRYPRSVYAYRNWYPRSSYRYRYYSPRVYRPYAYRAYAARSCYGPYGYRTYWRGPYTRPYVSISPFYTRAFTVLTLDDELFDGPSQPAASSPAADHDGLPHARTTRVGARFLIADG